MKQKNTNFLGGFIRGLSGWRAFSLILFILVVILFSGSIIWYISTGSIPTFLPMAITPTPTPTPTPTTTLTPAPTPISQYFVSNTGSDSNPGTLSQPFKTIQKGIDSLAAGNTLYVRGGIYNETVIESISGTSSAPIVISSYPGETAVIDGTGLSPAHTSPWQIVEIKGSYIIFQNFVLTNSGSRGITVDNSAQNVVLNNLNVNHIWFTGIVLYGNNGTVKNSQVWQTNLANSASPGSTGWGGALTFGDTGHPSWGINAVIYNDQVYQNWGEGILGMYTYNGLIEGNRVWDNWALDIYMDQVSNTTIDDNLVFYTDNRAFWKNALPSVGIELANEGTIEGYPVGHGRKIFNNITVNCVAGISFWTGRAPGAALIDDIITNNTIVSELTKSYGILIGVPGGNANHKNTIFENNLVLVPDGWSGYAQGATTGLTFSHNLWSKRPDPSINSTGDFIGDPQLVNPTQLVAPDQIANPLNAAGYAPTTSSPVINKASPVAEVVDDYFGKNRGNTPDIGAIEYIGLSAPAN